MTPITSTEVHDAKALRPLTDVWAWQLKAQCRRLGTDLFFPREGEGHGERIRRERSAKQICADCPVRAECRTHALSFREYHGVWGGTSERDRRDKGSPS
ncbi:MULTISPECIES: WhiB family transcriptional regulator [Rhodococcus]|uniref:Transcriptional regulator WhiB n=1 Tax=Rhodococcus wratislaviensis NBRC 100605 TaxID=1219028 RepID=X0PV49_RHOWR|nr:MULTISPECIES: WhiB family transcriptional regulator [Rhodococcus]WAM19133.1 WhiB family transcriptional regulator [Rhodococcus sp. JS3073]GAF47114.1 putative WhiB family regulatory protein [Rhodococcus wratislaviensis NBRC 100605]